MIDSLDFRFVAGLKGISIPTAGPAPSPYGHVPRTVEVLHDAGYSVQSAQQYPSVDVERGREKTILRIPARAEWDRTRWLIEAENIHGQEVEFTILIERVWWALGRDGTEPSQWEDRPVRLSPEDFTATSDRAIWLRFPKPRWASVVAAGFRREDSRSFSVKVTDSAVPIPLRDFSGVRELNDRGGEHQFKVWLETGPITHEVTIAVLPPVAPEPALGVSLSISDGVGWGRYKTASARARLQTGSGEINVIGHPVDLYFGNAPPKAHCFLRRFRQMPVVHQALSNLDVDVTVQGSSPTTIRQAKAVVHAIARALWSYDRRLMRPLKQAGFGGVAVSQMHRQCSFGKKGEKGK